jgi:hypothetical protein
MTDFSPAAAAVRAAYSQGCYLLMPHCKHQLDGMACPGLAAALRAAADQAADLQIPWSYTGESYQIYDEGLHAAAGHLRAIAAELDGANPTNQEDYEV